MATPVRISIEAHGASQVAAEFERVKASLGGVTGGLGTLTSLAGTIVGAAGFAGIALATVGAVRAGLEYNTTIERQTASFKTLLGSTEAAQQRMEDLADFASSTPFELPEVVQASRLLQSLTGGALASGDALRLVGDAAAATGRSFEETAQWIGRLYSGLKSGTPVGEATNRLLEMGLISGDTKRELEGLAKSGAATGNTMEVIERTFRSTTGAMAEQAKTMSGLNSTLADTMKALAADAMLPVWNALKDTLTQVLQALGAIPTAAQRVAEASTQVQASILGMAKAQTEETRVSNLAKLKAQQEEYNRSLEMTRARLQAINEEFERNKNKPMFLRQGVTDRLLPEQQELEAREVALRTEINATEVAIRRLESAGAKAIASAGSAAATVAATERERMESMGIFGPGNVQGENDFNRRQDLDRGEFGPGNRAGEMALEEQRIRTREQSDAEALRMQQGITEEMRRQNADAVRHNQVLRERNDVTFQIRQNIEALPTPAENFANLFVGTIRSAMDSVGYSLSGLIQGTMTWADALRNVANTMLTSVINAIVRMFTEWALKRIFLKNTEVAASTAEATAKAPGALFSSVSSFGVAAAVGVAALIAAMAAISGAFAEGGRPEVGRPALVGELGPELFIPDRAGTIIPADATADVLRAQSTASGSTGESNERPVRIVVLDDRNKASELMRDPRFRSTLLDLRESLS
jgi:hypothetical protein